MEREQRSRIDIPIRQRGKDRRFVARRDDGDRKTAFGNSTVAVSDAHGEILDARQTRCPAQQARRVDAGTGWAGDERVGQARCDILYVASQQIERDEAALYRAAILHHGQFRQIVHRVHGDGDTGRHRRAQPVGDAVGEAVRSREIRIRAIGPRSPRHGRRDQRAICRAAQDRNAQQIAIGVAVIGQKIDEYVLIFIAAAAVIGRDWRVIRHRDERDIVDGHAAVEVTHRNQVEGKQRAVTAVDPCKRNGHRRAARQWIAGHGHAGGKVERPIGLKVEQGVGQVQPVQIAQQRLARDRIKQRHFKGIRRQRIVRPQHRRPDLETDFRCAIGQDELLIERGQEAAVLGKDAHPAGHDAATHWRPARRRTKIAILERRGRWRPRRQQGERRTNHDNRHRTACPRQRNGANGTRDWRCDRYDRYDRQVSQTWQAPFTQPQRFIHHPANGRGRQFRQAKFMPHFMDEHGEQVVAPCRRATVDRKHPSARRQELARSVRRNIDEPAMPGAIRINRDDMARMNRQRRTLMIGHGKFKVGQFLRIAVADPRCDPRKARVIDEAGQLFQRDGRSGGRDRDPFGRDLRRTGHDPVDRGDRRKAQIVEQIDLADGRAQILGSIGDRIDERRVLQILLVFLRRRHVFMGDGDGRRTALIFVRDDYGEFAGREHAGAQIDLTRALFLIGDQRIDGGQPRSFEPHADLRAGLQHIGLVDLEGQIGLVLRHIDEIVGDRIQTRQNSARFHLDRFPDVAIGQEGVDDLCERRAGPHDQRIIVLVGEQLVEAVFDCVGDIGFQPLQTRFILRIGTQRHRHAGAFDQRVQTIVQRFRRNTGGLEYLVGRLEIFVDHVDFLSGIETGPADHLGGQLRFDKVQRRQLEIADRDLVGQVDLTVEKVLPDLDQHLLDQRLGIGVDHEQRSDIDVADGVGVGQAEQVELEPLPAMKCEAWNFVGNREAPGIVIQFAGRNAFQMDVEGFARALFEIAVEDALDGRTTGIGRFAIVGGDVHLATADNRPEVRPAACDGIEPAGADAVCDVEMGRGRRIAGDHLVRRTDPHRHAGAGDLGRIDKVPRFHIPLIERGYAEYFGPDAIVGDAPIDIQTLELGHVGVDRTGIPLPDATMRAACPQSGEIVQIETGYTRHHATQIAGYIRRADVAPVGRRRREGLRRRILIIIVAETDVRPQFDVGIEEIAELHRVELYAQCLRQILELLDTERHLGGACRFDHALADAAQDRARRDQCQATGADRRTDSPHRGSDRSHGKRQRFEAAIGLGNVEQGVDRNIQRILHEIMRVQRGHVNAARDPAIIAQALNDLAIDHRAARMADEMQWRTEQRVVRFSVQIHERGEQRVGGSFGEARFGMGGFADPIGNQHDRLARIGGQHITGDNPGRVAHVRPCAFILVIEQDDTAPAQA